MENLVLCKSAIFRSAVSESLLLTQENHPKEAGFSCWMDLDENVVINEPILGQKDYSFSEHFQMRNVQQPLTGFCEGEGSQTIIRFHTHPGHEDGPLWSDAEEWLLSPSMADIRNLFYLAKLNHSIAGLTGKTYWINPITVIGSPQSDKWTLIQIDPTTACQVDFKSDELCLNGLRSMYEHYYPQHAKRATSPIGKILQEPWLSELAIELGSVKFIRTSAKRYREFIDAAGVTWVVVDPLNFPQAINFSYKIEDIQENIVEEDDEDDLGDFGYEDD